MAEIEGPEYGVNLVADHGRWNNFFQEIRGKVTLEICALGACRTKQFDISAADIIAWGVRIAELMAEEAATAKVPVGTSGGGNPDGYTPLYTGTMTLDVEVANQDDLGIIVPPYVYDDDFPPED